MTASHLAHLRPVAELAAGKPHGVRLRYMAGCRCDACRRANTDYEIQRARARKAGDWNGIVPALGARDHMKWLSRHGVGRRAVQASTDIGDTVLSDILSGRKTRIRARTARKILAVTPAQAADHALISARKAKRLIASLRAEGYSERYLAKRLGYKNPYLQFASNRITVRNSARIERLYRELTT